MVSWRCFRKLGYTGQETVTRKLLLFLPAVSPTDRMRDWVRSSRADTLFIDQGMEKESSCSETPPLTLENGELLKGKSSRERGGDFQELSGVRAVLRTPLRTALNVPSKVGSGGDSVQ